MYRTFLSWRYLRHRLTSLIGIVGIFVAVSALIMILSIMTGFLEQSKKTLRGSLSDIIVTNVDRPRPDGRLVQREPDAILEAVTSDRRVAAASAHLVWFGLITREGFASSSIWENSQYAQYVGIKMVGIDAGAEYQATELRAALEREPLYGERVADPDDPFAPPPGYEPEGRPRRSVIVGDQLFSIHRLRRGGHVDLMTAVRDPRTGEWGTSNREYVVAGTFRSGENEMDLERVYVEREELADFLGGQRTFSEVLVRLHDYERDGRAVRDDLRQRLDEEGLIAGIDPFTEVRTWEEFRKVLLGAIENERVLMAIMLSLVLLVAGFTIFAILSMMVTQKRRDIGILTALGATPRGVMSVFFLIAFWEALLGATSGALAGSWAALKIDSIERWLSNTLGVQIFNRDVYLFDHIPSVVEPWRVALIVAGAFACALVFASIPAWKAARLDPLEALRYE